MKKVLFFALLLMILGAASVNAQVTIGEDSEPHPGAVLDLKASKGLLLPKVTLVNVNIFQLSTEKEAEAVGMMVYNNYDATIGGQGKGIYVWDGSKWMFAGTSGPVQTPVTSVAVRSQNDITSVMSGSTLQFYADVEPANATNRNVIWSVVPGGTGTGTIDPVDGLLSANSPGTVTVRATALDGSNQYGQKQITVAPATIPVTGISISPSTTQTINVTGTVQFTAMIEPNNASEQMVIWSITAPAGTTGATVSQSGLFTGLAAGTYTLSAVAAGNPGAQRTVEIVVVATPADATCSGCIALLEQENISKTVYPYYLAGPYDYCYAASVLGEKLAFNFVLYYWKNETWVHEKSGAGKQGVPVCSGPR